MEKYLSAVLLFVFSFFYSQAAPPYQAGDYRSKASGIWTTPGSWEVYNGTTWSTLTTGYPGFNTSTTAQGAFNVFIKPGDNITVNTNLTLYFKDLYILASPLPITSSTQYGQLTLTGPSSGTAFKLLGTDQDIFVLGGTIMFDPAANNLNLDILLGNSLVITNYNGVYDPGTKSGTGTNGIQPDGGAGSGGCSASTLIKFITYQTKNTTVTEKENNYGVCNSSSGNSTYTFPELNAHGGSLYSHPSAVPTEICTGQQITLSGSYSGFVPWNTTNDTPLYPINYQWTGTGPSGYTFASTSVNPGTILLTTPGTYVYSLHIYYNDTNVGYTISSTESVTVTVYAQGSGKCACYKTPVTDTNTYPSKAGITSLGRAGNSDADKWPMYRQSGSLVLESQTKGFVINRLTTTQILAISNPQDGMMVYDTDDDCLKIYSTDNAATTTVNEEGWHCFSTPACPD